MHQGRREDQHVQSKFTDLVPLSQRDDLKDRQRSIDRPSEEEVLSTAERTRLALESIVHGKVKSTQPKNVPGASANTSYLRYTPASQGPDGKKQRIIKMTEVVEDPLEPPKHRFKKVPNGPPSPPAPVLRSPPRKVTAQEQKEWMIPPCISNWKNNKGYTIPLDKRLAASGRGMQDVEVNDNFAQFAEALNMADRHAREEVRQRNIMQQKIAAQEKAAREESLRMLAQRARDERAGISSHDDRLAHSGSALTAYGSSESDDEDDEDVAQRNRLREERRRERERELRMSNMGQEQRARAFAKEQNRDISEKVALGLAKPTMSKESMTDARLFNREALLIHLVTMIRTMYTINRYSKGLLRPQPSIGVRALVAQTKCSETVPKVVSKMSCNMTGLAWESKEDLKELRVKKRALVLYSLRKTTVILSLLTSSWMKLSVV